MATTASSTDATKQPPLPFLRMSLFASVKLTIVLLFLIATTVLLGAWCPQEASVGRDKVIEQFGPKVAAEMIRYGIADIFHTPWFLGLIGLLTVNMVACSVQRVFPKVRSLRQPMPFLAGKEIQKMPVAVSATVAATPDYALHVLTAKLKRAGYKLAFKDRKIAGHWGKIGRLAPTVTHIGLLMLLAGVTITSWTGFSGFQSVLLGQDMNFDQSEHSKQWLGKLPDWHVRVDATRREDYATGDPKQWYSTLTVVDPFGRELKKQEISVNNPLSYEGVDIYQSSWGLAELELAFNGHTHRLPLRSMGRVHAAMLPLDDKTIMIFSVHGQNDPIRVFAKIPTWQQPRILTVLTKDKPAQLGDVKVEYKRLIPQTGLQYKCDPGLPLTYVAFGFIMVGCLLAAVPHRQLWASIEAADTGGATLVIGGVSKKAKTAFGKNVQKTLAAVVAELDNNGAEPGLVKANDAALQGQSAEEEEPCPISS